MDIKIPDLGDGIDSATVLSILVAPGDIVNKDDTLIELETDKAVAPVPSPENGKIDHISIQVGASVTTGTAIGSLSSENESAKMPTPVPDQSPAAISPVPVTPVVPIPVASVPGQPFQLSPTDHIKTSPSIRRFSELSGLDLGRIVGTGTSGRVTWEDVKQYMISIQKIALNSVNGNHPVPQQAPAEVHEVLPQHIATDFAKFGPVEIKPVSTLRQKISSNLRQTWQITPHVTQFDEADITDLMAIRKTYNSKYEKKGAKLTLTVFAIKAIYEALQQFPQFNASFDESTGDMILKKYHHIGIAVDTDNGLMVPVIRDVGKKSLLQLATELTEIAQLARDRKITVEKMQGSTFTLSNLGGLGVGPFTPLVNAPDVAILGLGRGKMKPIYDGKNAFSPRLMMPVCVSYDHRVIDGGDGARFTRFVIDQFESFSETLVQDGLK